jgi:hypothetical protein
MFSRDELQAGFQHYQDTVQRAADSGDWNLFVDLFTEDATYSEHCYGSFVGREQIRRWALRTMSAFPGNVMPSFPVAWSVLDPERGWIVCEIRNLLRDPGDGSVHEASNYTRLHYAGRNGADDAMFSFEEDVYNPAKFQQAVVAWARVADAHGTLPADGRAWLDAFAPGWNVPAG